MKKKMKRNSIGTQGKVESAEMSASPAPKSDRLNIGRVQKLELKKKPGQENGVKNFPINIGITSTQSIMGYRLKLTIANSQNKMGNAPFVELRQIN